jgi:general nucleoside transport system ATP-binding protein
MGDVTRKDVEEIEYDRGPTVPVVSSAASPRLVVAQVTKRYAKAIALDHVTVTVEPGEFVAVIGRSGAGKTTLLRCLAGAVAVSEGVIRVGATSSPATSSQHA